MEYAVFAEPETGTTIYNKKHCGGGTACGKGCRDPALANLVGGKMKIKLPLLVLAGFLSLTGCATMNTFFGPKPKLPAAGAEQDKITFVQKQLGFSAAQKSWTQHLETIRGWSEGKYWKIFTYMFAKPKIDVDALKKVKKVAILSFDVRVDAKRQQTTTTAGNMEITTTGGIDLTPMQPFVNTMYDALKTSLEKQGITVIPVDEVKNNPDYIAMDFKVVEPELKSGFWWHDTAGAYGLKQIDGNTILQMYGEREEKKIYGAERVEKAKQGAAVKALRAVGNADKHLARGIRMQAAAKALGVDAIILANNSVSMDFGALHKYKLKFAHQDTLAPGGISVNMYFADEVTPIWSAEMKKSMEVPTNAKSKEGIFTVASYELDKVAPDLVRVYSGLADLIALKLKLDKEAPPAK